VTIYEIYCRLLTELHWTKASGLTRLALQDVLCALREKAAIEQGISQQEVQDNAESIATTAVMQEGVK
jgi:hypothetical protein